MKHTVRKAEAGQIGEKELAYVAHGAAHVAREELPSLLCLTAAKEADQRLSGFRILDLAKTALAFASIKQPDKKLFTTIASAAY